MNWNIILQKSMYYIKMCLEKKRRGEWGGCGEKAGVLLMKGELCKPCLPPLLS